ncbi:MAG: hypothetical protein ACREDS_10495 [Limisphaerales bacterium]
MAESDLFEEMLATYPAEKRDLARQVYHRFADGDSSNFFTQLLIVLDVYSRYAERIPKAVIEANHDALATIQDMREEITMLAKTIETRDVSVSNHAEKTDELCKITIAKCNETVSRIELMLKNLGSQVDTNAVVKKFEEGVKSTFLPIHVRASEIANTISPMVEKMNRAAERASQLWPRRIWEMALTTGTIVGLMVALAVGTVIYFKLHDYYERETASRIAYAQEIINYNQGAFKQLAIAQQPIKVMRTEESGVINQGYALEVPNADAVETRVENGQTNAYVYFTSSLVEQELQKIQKATTELQKMNQQFGKTNSPR